MILTPILVVTIAMTTLIATCWHRMWGQRTKEDTKEATSIKYESPVKIEDQSSSSINQDADTEREVQSQQRSIQKHLFYQKQPISKVGTPLPSLSIKKQPRHMFDMEVEFSDIKQDVIHCSRRKNGMIGDD